MNPALVCNYSMYSFLNYPVAKPILSLVCLLPNISSSNCVVNLSPDKEAVLKEAHRVLKVRLASPWFQFETLTVFLFVLHYVCWGQTGGEFYFSDIYSSQEVPEAIKRNKVLWGML